MLDQRSLRKTYHCSLTLTLGNQWVCTAIFTRARARENRQTPFSRLDEEDAAQHEVNGLRVPNTPHMDPPEKNPESNFIEKLRKPRNGEKRAQEATD